MSHNQKSELIWSVAIYWHIYSKLLIQLEARWQFYNKTQPPVLIVSLIIFSTCSPYPCPKEILMTSFIPRSLTNWSKSAFGSFPGVSKINKGYLHYESSYIFLRVVFGVSINLVPIFLLTNYFTWVKNLSYLNIFTNISCKKSSFRISDYIF